jgi:hypothetical protein
LDFQTSWELVRTIEFNQKMNLLLFASESKSIQ